MRTGGSLPAETVADGSSPQTRIDSNQGSAMVTPAPRSTLRRESRCRLQSAAGGSSATESLTFLDIEPELLMQQFETRRDTKMLAADHDLQ
ncbi:MAG: hypothetical protein MK165_19450 [Pirellulaceae bacterium]|nr:hypothetical protein [Pirellulaceae bacterium]